MASSPSSVLLAKHWGPERLVEILREPNCSLGISIVGGKVRNGIIMGVLIPKVRLKFSHLLKVIRMQYLDCQQTLYCTVCVCVYVCLRVYVPVEELYYTAHMLV
jgi:hypothetical protein